MWRAKRLTGAHSLLAAVAAALIFASAALAGTVTIRDKRDKIPDCMDIKTVVANAGAKTISFTVVMFGSAKAKPCRGKVSPVISILKYGAGQCSAFIYQGKQGKPTFNCEGSGGGRAKFAIDKTNPAQWDISFATSELPRGGTAPRTLEFSVFCATSKNSDDTLDSTHNKQVALHIG